MRPASPGQNGAIEWTSSVPAALRPAVEALFFFNPRQAAVLARIEEALDLTGRPMIVESGERISINLPDGHAQCLFACDTRASTRTPVGVVLFDRPAKDVLRILHVAVLPAFAMNPARGATGLVTEMIAKVREVAAAISGVTRVKLPYRPDAFSRVK